MLTMAIITNHVALNAWASATRSFQSWRFRCAESVPGFRVGGCSICGAAAVVFVCVRARADDLVTYGREVQGRGGAYPTAKSSAVCQVAMPCSDSRTPLAE